MSFTTAGRALMLGIAALALAGTAQAQGGPTPEGTTIKNKATATYKDGVGPSATTYTAAPDSVMVTVGFKAGITLPDTVTQTPAANSQDNEYTFTITNSGNGTDSVKVAFTPSSANISITGYRIGLTTYADAAALDAALSSRAIPMDGTVDITVVYDVANVVGGAAEDIDVVVTSRRQSAVSAAHTLVIIPASVAVTPDGGTVNRLPGNHTAVFTIINNSSLPMTYALTASSTNAAVLSAGAISQGTGGTFTGGATPTIQVPAGDTVTVNVAYAVPDTAAPTASATLGLNATSTGGAPGSPTVADNGSWVVTVERPFIVMTKQAWNEARDAQISTGVKPGDIIWYRVAVENTGNYAADSIVVSDALPAEVTYEGVEADAPDGAWTITGTSTVQGVLSTLAVATTRYFWIQVRVR